jgi:hypothetical protein
VKVEVCRFTKVPELKCLLQDRFGILIDQQRLGFKGKLLRDDKTLGQYRIAPLETVTLSRRFHGGSQFRKWVSF